MIVLLLLVIAVIIAFISYKLLLNQFDNKDKEEKDKNMKDYDKYYNKLEELSSKVKDLNDIGIIGYANKFVWSKFKNSILLKIAAIVPFISSFVITVQKLEPIYHIISLLLPMGLIGLALILYRVINISKIAKEGSHEFLNLVTKYKKEIMDVEYNKLRTGILNLNTTIYTQEAANILKEFNKLYIDVLDVLNKQNSMKDNNKALILEKINASFEQGIDIGKTIFDILIVEDKLRSNLNNSNDLIKSKSEENLRHLKSLISILKQINESISMTILDIPKFSVDKDTIADTEMILKSLENSMEMALSVQNSLKEYRLNKTLN